MSLPTHLIFYHATPIFSATPSISVFRIPGERWLEPITSTNLPLPVTRRFHTFDRTVHRVSTFFFQSFSSSSSFFFPFSIFSNSHPIKKHRTEIRRSRVVSMSNRPMKTADLPAVASKSDTSRTLVSWSKGGGGGGNSSVNWRLAIGFN